ncbi:MAG: trehalase family glycosidase [Candidatus Saccharibacteria bacterium]|nr:trehalase family glycosidase [Candidatus Saccharibacteria bacterium]
MDDKAATLERAKEVLNKNDRGNFTVPAPELYPHQWLWDSCFVAIGLRHLDIDRAQAEVLRMLGGQWSNGMIPNMIISDEHHNTRDAKFWRSWINPNAPYDLSTSGITQPPVLAEAIVRIGKKLSAAERRAWYKKVYPKLLAYHEWLHDERDPHQEGLTIQIHPWETGLDNTPPWMKELHEHQMPLWIQAVKKLRLGSVFKFFRRDTKRIPAEQRLDTVEALSLYSVQRRLRRKMYDINRILSHSHFAIEDLSFNCILIRNDQLLLDIAKTIKEEVPDNLQEQMAKTQGALETLWDPYGNQYYSRNFVTHQLIKEPSIAGLMPLYAGTISKERAELLIKQLENDHAYGTPYPVPSVSVESPWFKELGYWQGSTWVNTNWLLIDGLKRLGFDDHASALKESTLEMVGASEIHEYYSPLSGKPGGASNFSWTAALTVDLLKTKEKK